MNFELDLRQQQTLTQYMYFTLQVLKMDPQQLMNAVEEALASNPVIEAKEEGYAWPGRTLSGGGFIEGLTRAPAPDLRDDLRLQLAVDAKYSWEKALGGYMIDALDERGYLRENVHSIAKQTNVPEKYVRYLLKKMQGFEPAGIFARSLRECLCLQLRRSPQDSTLAEQIVLHHLELLSNGNLTRIAQLTRTDIASVTAAARRIRSLQPYPCAGTLGDDAQYVIPDITVAVEDGRPVVGTVRYLPELHLSDACGDYLDADAGAEGNHYIRAEIQRARDLLGALERRKNTLLSAAGCIVERQSAFFLKGSAPVPLTYAEIAEQLGLNVSTISRALSGKYLLFAERLYPIPFFFPARLAENRSSEDAKLLLKQLIDAEDRAQPLTDDALANLITQSGVALSRRTVSKYRMEEHIPSASARKMQYTLS